VAATLASHNLPTNRARELIKPSTDSASLRLETEKKFFRLGFWVLCVLRHNESMFVHFWRLCLALAPSQWELFSLKVFLDLWLENESLEPLIDLLAYLDLKLRLKNPVFGKNLKFSIKVTLATSIQLWPLVVGSQIELESYSNPLKTREVFYIRFLKKLSQFFLVHDPMIGGCFANIFMMLSADPTRGYCGSKFYWIPDSNTRF